MSATELFASLVRQGYDLDAIGDQLDVDGPPLNDDLRGLIKDNKSGLCRLATLKPDAGADWPWIARDAVELTELANRTEAAKESRHGELLEMMRADDQGKKYFYLTDTDSNTRFVILAMAIRGVATFELKIPRERYDPFLLMQALQDMEDYPQ